MPKRQALAAPRIAQLPAETAPDQLSVQQPELPSTFVADLCSTAHLITSEFADAVKHIDKPAKFKQRITIEISD